MSLPSYESFMRPLLEELREAPVRPLGEVSRAVAARLRIPRAAALETFPWNGQTVLEARVDQAATALAHAGLAIRDRGELAITPKGRDALEEAPERIDRAYLCRYPEFAAHLDEVLARRGA